MAAAHCMVKVLRCHRPRLANKKPAAALDTHGIQQEVVQGVLSGQPGYCRGLQFTELLLKVSVEPAGKLPLGVPPLRPLEHPNVLHGCIVNYA